jgi:hypothetical protein
MAKLKSLLLGTALALAVTAPAIAAPMTGTFDLTGLFRAENNSGTTVAFANATAIDFCASTIGNCTTNPGAGSPGTGAIMVNNTSAGNTFGVSDGNTGTIKDFFFNPFSSITSFYTIGGLTFDLLDLTTQVLVAGKFQTIIMAGDGIFHRAGFDDTAGTFSFTGQNDGLNLIGTFSFSGASAAFPVPEPATFGLLGMGLLGLGAAARSRRRNSEG